MRYIPNIQFTSNEEHYDNSLSSGVPYFGHGWEFLWHLYQHIPAISGFSAQPCRKVDWSWDGRSAVRRESYSNSELNQHKEKKLTGRFVWMIWLRWVDGIYIYTIQCVLIDVYYIYVYCNMLLYIIEYIYSDIYIYILYNILIYYTYIYTYKYTYTYTYTHTYLYIYTHTHIHTHTRTHTHTDIHTYIHRYIRIALMPSTSLTEHPSLRPQIFHQQGLSVTRSSARVLVCPKTWSRSGGTCWRIVA